MAVSREIISQPSKIDFLNQEKYSKLFERSSDSVLVLATNLAIVECNRRALELLGYDKEELIGKTPVDISPAYQPDGTLSKKLIDLDISKTIKGGDHQIEWVLISKNNAHIPVEISLSVFSNEGEMYLYAFIKDLTEIREKEQAFYESEERFRTLFNQSMDAIMIYDPVKGFLGCNPAALSILKIDSQEQIFGVHPWQISPLMQPDAARTVSEVKAKNNHEVCMREGHTRFEWFLTDREGTDKWFDVALTRIQLQNKKLIHVLFREITDLKVYQSGLEEIVRERTKELEMANAELKLSNEELALINEQMHIQSQELERAFEKLKLTQGMLIHSEKIASLGTINAGIGHEINNPLNFIQNGVEILKNQLGNQGKADLQNSLPIFQAIEEGVSRISKIVESLNRFSRDADNWTEVDLNEVVQDTMRLINYQVANRIDITTKLYKGELPVRGIEGRLHQVMLNLLLNAIQSIDGRGEVKIQTNRHDQMLFVSVKDTGTGISDEHLAKVFDPFFTTKAPGEGTGLGLSIVSEIVTEHEGEISINSESGKGTTIILSFPSAQSLRKS